MNRRIFLGLFLATIVAIGGCQSAAEDAPSILNPPGTVVLLRHAIAPGGGDPQTFQLDDCTTQRNLSDEGRAQARTIGAAFRRQRIPIHAVLSSQWCRCLETAKLLDLGPVTPTPALNSFFRDRSTEAAQTAATQRLIAAHRQQPGVLIMVTHQVNITALTGIVPQSGAAVVVRATPEGTLQVVGELPPNP